ncbi:response regulator [Candidatus Poriferisodalis sp.]|uniref:response regulator n=1 Tax=Candidatus Poriferisodalis sp. TaxID=3101277 RepID=UPI003B020EE0
MTEVLLATDADWVVEEVAAALSGPDVTFRVVRSGQEVRPAVEASTPDLVILDFQIGNMGGMASCLDLRLESGMGRLPRVPVLMLADREADIFLARRSDADAWLVKPLNPMQLRRTALGLLSAGASGDTADAS